MANSVTVKVDMSKCKKLRSEIKPRGLQIVKKAAYDIKDGAMDRAPFKTGFLKNSMIVEPEDGGMTQKIGPAAEYGIFQELGTRFMRAHPYLGPAFEHVRAGFVAAWKELVRQ